MKSIPILVDGKPYESVNLAALSVGFRYKSFQGYLSKNHPGPQEVFAWNGHWFSYDLKAQMPNAIAPVLRNRGIAPKSSGFVEIASPLEPSPPTTAKSSDEVKRKEIMHIAEEVAQINIEMFGLRERQKRLLQALEDLRREYGIEIKGGKTCLKK